MDDAERAFRDALHRVDSVKIPVAPLEPGNVRRTRGRGLALGRWVAAAAAVAIVAGLGAWVLTLRGQPVSAVPAAPVSVTASVKLTGTTWIAIEFAGKPTVFAPDKMPLLEFKNDSTFTGADPCNEVGGQYRLVGSDLTVTRTGSTTAMACNTAQQEAFVKVLDDTRRVSRDGDTIALLDSPGTVLARFRDSEAYTTPGPTPTPPIATEVPSAGPTSTPTPTMTNHPASAILFRIRNASGVDFTDVYAIFPTGEKVHYGPVAAGAVSRYEPVQQAYSYGYLKVTTAAKSYVYQPVDYVGESELPAGHYGYVVDIVDGRIDLQLERD
jgi:heat shock protein HslJ